MLHFPSSTPAVQQPPAAQPDRPSTSPEPMDPVDPGNWRSRCEQCAVRQSCFFAISDEWPDAVTVELRDVAAGQALQPSRSGVPMVHVVRRGTFRTVWRTPDGREQSKAFHVDGDTLGLPLRAPHAGTSTAMEDSQVCSAAYSAQARRHVMREALWTRLSIDAIRAHQKGVVPPQPEAAGSAR